MPYGAILLMLVGAWHANLAAVSASFRQATAPFGNRLRHQGLQQRWMVFSPMPLLNDGWFELQVQPASGSPQRLLVPSLTPRNGTSNPFRSGRVVRNQRQRKFFLNLQEPEHAKAAAAYVRHACRQLSASPGFRPSQLELEWMQETSQPPPLPPAPVVAVPRLRQGWCSAGVLRQPGRQVGGAVEVEQGVYQRLQPLQRQRLDTGDGGLAEGAAAAGEQAKGHLHFAASFPPGFPTSLPFLPAFLPAFLDQLLGGPGVTQLLGGNLDDHHHLLQGEVGVPLHQDR